jgi:serine/threonine-protein kinase
MLSGSPPFTGASTASILVKQLSEAPAPLSQRAPWVPPALAAATMRLLAKSADSRFPDADAFLRALDAPVGPEPVAAFGASQGTPVAPPIGRPPSNQSPFPGFAPLPPPAPAMPPPYGGPVAPAMPPSLRNTPLTRAERKALRRAWRDGEPVDPAQAREAAIRMFRGTLVRCGGTMLFLSALSVVTSPHFFWAIFPDLGLGLTVFMAGGRLWSHNGVSPREVFRPLPEPSMHLPSGTGEGGAFGGVPERVPSASSLASATVLGGPFGTVVRRAALDRDRVHDIIAGLDRREREQVPNAEATAKGLASQVGALAGALHRIDVESPPSQRTALADRRSALAAQMDRASIMLQTLYLDLVRFRVSNASSGADGVAGVTEQASALSRDIGYLLGAAEELRAMDGPAR